MDVRVEQSIELASDPVRELWLHGRPAHTQRAYRADVGRWLAFVGAPLASVTLGDVQAFSDSV